MTVKEVLVQALRDEGYDFVTACEIATKRLAELEPGGHNLAVGGYMFLIDVAD